MDRASTPPADGLETRDERSRCRPKAGFQKDSEVVVRFVELLDGIAARLRDRIEALAGPDPISQDLLIGIAQGVERHLWMLRVQARGS